MKFTILKASFFALAIILTAAACTEGDEPSAPETELTLGDFIATIDGEEYKAIGTVGSIIQGSGLPIDAFLITGLKNIGFTRIEQLAVIFGVPVAQSISSNSTFTENFDVDGECDEINTICSAIEYLVTDSTDPNNNAQYFSNQPGGANSTISFTEIDYQKGGTAKGTFSGTIIDGNGQVVVITDGKFYVSIQ